MSNEKLIAKLKALPEAFLCSLVYVDKSLDEVATANALREVYLTDTLYEVPVEEVYDKRDYTEEQFESVVDYMKQEIINEFGFYSDTMTEDVFIPDDALRAIENILKHYKLEFDLIKSLKVLSIDSNTQDYYSNSTFDTIVYKLANEEFVGLELCRDSYDTAETARRFEPMVGEKQIVYRFK